MREVYSIQLAIVVGVLVFLVSAVFALVQSPEILSAPDRRSMCPAHPVEGYEQCGACHGIKGPMPYPIKHLGWSNQSCTKCHIPLPATTDAAAADAAEGVGGKAPQNPHPAKGWENCVECHAIDGGVMPAPANHKEFADNMCSGCHLREQDRGRVVQSSNALEIGRTLSHKHLS